MTWWAFRYSVCVHRTLGPIDVCTNLQAEACKFLSPFYSLLYIYSNSYSTWEILISGVIHSAKIYNFMCWVGKAKKKCFPELLRFSSPSIYFLSCTCTDWLTSLSTNGWSPLMYNSCNQNFASVHNFKTYVLCAQVGYL